MKKHITFNRVTAGFEFKFFRASCALQVLWTRPLIFFHPLGFEISAHRSPNPTNPTKRLPWRAQLKITILGIRFSGYI